MNKTTDEIIKDCFKKASFTGDKAQYLYKLLSAEMNIKFEKARKKFEADAIDNLVVNEGYSLVSPDGEYEIKTADSSAKYTGDKNFVVEHHYKASKAYNTIKGAMKYIEENS